MAAVLKKRALAEFSQVIQEPPKPPLKRLRITQKQKSIEPEIILNNASSSQETLEQLQNFSQNQLPVSCEYIDGILRALLDHCCKSKHAAVRAKIASLVAQLVATEGFNPAAVPDDIIPLLKNEESHVVKSQYIMCLLSIGKALPQDTKLHQVLVQSAKQNLNDTSHLVRCKCLDLIGWLGSPDQRLAEESQSGKSTQRVLGEFTHDQDPRVRTCAFQAMLHWHNRGIKLDAGIYNAVCDALRDDYEGVRLVTVSLIWTLSQLYPDSLVKVKNTEEVRLIDDAFGKICNMVNDISMVIRVKASSLLGTMHDVSVKFLEQTLDKKLMSNMRRKTSAHDRAKEHFAAGEWATGSKWASDAPKDLIQENDVSVIDTGACGAFVHGLEDEYLEVRTAAIESLCQLATRSPSFAALSQDSLVDMFNDEIEDVRLNAIRSLKRIAIHLTLREDQLEIITGCLKDFSYDMREALHEMFECIHMGTKTCLNECIMALLDNLKRYPQDRLSIWKSCQYIGKNHPHLTLALTTELLSTHPYFDTPEPDMDDPAYIAVLILVFNATVDNPTMVPLFPDHTFRHYQYLRDSIPEHVPGLNLPGVCSMHKVKKDASQELSRFLNNALERLSKVETMNRNSAQQLMEVTIRDLSRLSELEPKLSATTESMSIYIQCHLLVSKAVADLKTSGRGHKVCNVTSTSMSKVKKLTQKLESLFVGLTISDLAVIRQLGLKAYCLQLLATIHGNSRDAACLQMCDDVYQRVTELESFLSTHNMPFDPFTARLVSELGELESRQPAIFLRVLQSTLGLHKIDIHTLSNNVQKAHVVIHEPVSESDNPIRFTAGLTVGVQFIAIIENIDDSHNLRLKIKYPDQEEQYVSIKQADCKAMGGNKYRVSTEVILSHTLWSDPCYIELSLAKAFTSNYNSSDTEISSTNKLETVDLCTPVKVYVSPRPGKR
ncbi:unnamed protein product [Owenia fusiformis]|uniref:Integrator complex subunit 4 n=1 Tax=Owenia fusiformis TaxID=6347 RepID=A0A8S4NPD9_OWEFU|nr:unnamed protein product [Owenia fusiformis]